MTHAFSLTYVSGVVQSTCFVKLFAMHLLCSYIFFSLSNTPSHTHTHPHTLTHTHTHTHTNTHPHTGTSMAAPHVAGVMAKYLTTEDLDPDAMKTKLKLELVFSTNRYEIYKHHTHTHAHTHTHTRTHTHTHTHRASKDKIQGNLKETPNELVFKDCA